jgi:hypothetical protein
MSVRLTVNPVQITPVDLLDVLLQFTTISELVFATFEYASIWTRLVTAAPQAVVLLACTIWVCQDVVRMG